MENDVGLGLSPLLNRATAVSKYYKEKESNDFEKRRQTSAAGDRVDAVPKSSAETFSSVTTTLFGLVGRFWSFFWDRDKGCESGDETAAEASIQYEMEDSVVEKKTSVVMVQGEKTSGGDNNTTEEKIVAQQEYETGGVVDDAVSSALGNVIGNDHSLIMVQCDKETNVTKTRQVVARNHGEIQTASSSATNNTRAA